MLLFAKTGTLTEGRPTVAEVVTTGALSSDEALRLAASVDQISPHVLADAVVHAAGERGLELSLPDRVEEIAGRGVRGRVDGRAVSVGKAAWAAGTDVHWLRTVRRRAERDGMLTVFVTVDGQPAGALLLSDPIRRDATGTIRRLRQEGLTGSSW